MESKLGIDKNLISVKSSPTSPGDPVRFLHLDRVENEAEAVAKEIKKLKNEEKYEWSDFSVLVRANNHAEPFIYAFQRSAIPCQFLGPGRLFRQPEIVDLISYLKVLYDFADSVSFYRLLSLDYFEIDSKDLIRISGYARKFNLSLFEAVEKIDDVGVTDETKEKTNKLLTIINTHFNLIKKETAGQILYYFLESTELLQKILNPDNADAEKKAQNISKFFDKLKTYEVDHEDATVSAVVDWIDLSSELGESPLAADTDWSKANAVNVLTIHSAKGLEFPVVFLVNLVSQRFPTNERHEQIPIPETIIKEVLPQGDYHLQEERRLFYVGMTRAKDFLYLTAADFYGEGKREKKLSLFIFEALGDESASSEKEEDKVQQLSFLDYQSPSPDQLITVSEKESIHIDYLSYSQIETFKICPLHYKLKYLVKIPTPPSASQSFGTSIHESIREFYQRLKSGSKPSEKVICEILEDNWISEGYLSKSHETKFFQKGKLYLAGFLKVGFNAKITPISLEQRFTLPLPFKEGERPLKVGGVMDRVDLHPDGSLEIVDYKTAATIPTQREVDKNLQLTFYALAASTIREDLFNKDPKNVKLSLYFFDNQEKISTKRNMDQLNEAIDEIYKVRREIEESDFKCSNHMFCQGGCEYSIFCRS